MKNSLRLAIGMSAISVAIGIWGVGHSFAQERQRPSTIDTVADKSVGREGGQSGQSPHLEKRSEASRSRGEGRVGGQAGTETPLQTRKSSYGSMGGTRVGGQAGVERDVGTSSGTAK